MSRSQPQQKTGLRGLPGNIRKQHLMLQPHAVTNAVRFRRIKTFSTEIRWRRELTMDDA